MKPEDTRFTIVGLGLIGGSYARGLTKKGFCVDAIDTNADSIRYALGEKTKHQRARQRPAFSPR